MVLQAIGIAAMALPAMQNPPVRVWDITVEVKSVTILDTVRVKGQKPPAFFVNLAMSQTEEPKSVSYMTPAKTGKTIEPGRAWTRNFKWKQKGTWPRVSVYLFQEGDDPKLGLASAIRWDIHPTKEREYLVFPVHVPEGIYTLDGFPSFRGRFVRDTTLLGGHERRASIKLRITAKLGTSR